MNKSKKKVKFDDISIEEYFDEEFDFDECDDLYAYEDDIVPKPKTKKAWVTLFN